MRGAWLAVALVMLLAAPFATAEWGQFQGGAGRSGVASLPTGPFDVATAHRIPDEPIPVHGMPGLSPLATDHGWVMLASDDVSCTMHRAAEPDAVVWTSEPVAGCASGSLHAYSQAHEVFLLCQDGDGTTGRFQARGAEGSVRWSVRLGERPLGADAGEAAADVRWDCNDAALDPDHQVAYFVGSAWTAPERLVRGVVGAVDLASGDLLWKTQLRDTGADTPAAPEAAEADPLAPYRLTVSTSGVTVIGREILRAPDPLRVVGNNGEVSKQAFAAWLDHDGVQQGFRRAVPLAADDLAADAGAAASYGAVADGARTLFRLGTDILVVRPDQPNPLRVRAVDELDLHARGRLGSFTPVLDGDQLILPSAQGLGAFDAHTLEYRWSWAGLGTDWYVWNVIVAPRGDLVALAYREPAGDRIDEIEFLWLDATSGVLRQRLPLDFETSSSARGFGAYMQPLTLVPLDDRVVVRDREGAWTTILPARGGFPVRLEDAYPARNSEVAVVVPLRADVREVRVAWGDGVVDAASPEAQLGFGRVVTRDDEVRFEHAYRDAGRHEVTVTEVLDNGATRTASTMVYVGESPPPELTFMQRQFAPEHQDRTWGLIGLLLVMWGAAYGLWFRSRRRRRIARELARLERIQERSLEDPLLALRELAAAQRHLREALVVGHLDDAQYALLRHHAGSLATRLNARLLGPYGDRLSVAFQGALAAAFADGVVSHGEVQRLHEQLAGEKGLKRHERDALRRLVETWVPGSTSGEP